MFLLVGFEPFSILEFSRLMDVGAIGPKLFAKLIGIHPGGPSVGQTHGGGQTGGFTCDQADGHHPGAALTQPIGADAATGDQHVVHLARQEAAIGYAV